MMQPNELQELSRKQKEVFDFICEYLGDNGFAPTVREIGSFMGVKSSTVFDHLKYLESKGYIRRSDYKPRGIEVLIERLSSAIRIPELGRIPAGDPLLAIEDVSGYAPVPRSQFSAGTYFALKVVGTSMIEAGIMDGDYVVVRQQPTAENGQIIVAQVNDEATLKKFYREPDGRIRLQPANSELKPMYYDPRQDDIRIAGKVVFTYRYLDAKN